MTKSNWRKKGFNLVYNFSYPHQSFIHISLWWKNSDNSDTEPEDPEVLTTLEKECSLRKGSQYHWKDQAWQLEAICEIHVNNEG